jgi:sialate O-acetylesterase
MLLPSRVSSPMKTNLSTVRRLTPLAILLAALASLLPSLQAEVRLPKVFSDHMVLQQEKPPPVWGWAQPGETVTVQFLTESKQAQANDRGEWKVVLAPAKAGGPHTLTVSGSSTVKCEDVMVGEVWLCSGQSNMEMGIGACKDAQKEIAAADFPGIRLLKVTKKWTPAPETDQDATWKICSPKTVAEGGWVGFSAAAYYFGRELHQKLGVPVGLIDSSWGGTCIQTWTPPEGFAAVPALKSDFERVQLADARTAPHRERLEQTLNETQRWLEAARQALAARKPAPTMPTFPAELLPPRDVQHATALFNGMIQPVCPFAMRGAIWYQGESNLGDGAVYTERMKALISGWRQLWGLGDFPFYFVQIAPFNYGGDPEREAVLWEAQAAVVEAVPNTGMAVVNDISNLRDIHPNNKQDVGKRLALWALARTYHQPDVVFSGPTFKSLSTEGEKLRVTFEHAGAGLASRDGQPLNWFEVIDADEGGFVKANAQIEGASVVLSAPEVKRPVAMRFAWNMLAEPNLMNPAGLPASAFRAGNVPKRDLLVIRVPEAKEYQLVYDLDLGQLGDPITYQVNNSAKIKPPFDRIAYFLELTAGGDTKFLYVSMDAFTDDPAKIGVPTAASAAHFQRDVANLTVLSNVKDIKVGTGIQGGNLEFWPNNYAGDNSAKVPNASSQVYDFGDAPADPVAGYGSMQVHNHDARQTLFALNHWSVGQGADVGIGNQSGNNPDWTFAANAGSYQAKRLRVLVRCK